MYRFDRFATETHEHAVDLVRTNPFALVVSAAGGPPVGTHAPVLIEREAEGTFVGATLLGHLAKANPHWRTWEPDTEVLVVFTGPHGYVSPTSYAVDPAVPTWDYAAVHLTGRIEIITDVLDVVERTVAAMEAPRTPSWRPTPASREVFGKLVPGVVPFRVHVTAEERLFKLSQDKDDELRERVHRDADPELAALMDRVDPR